MAKYFIKRKNTKRIFEEGEAPAAPQQGQAPAAPAAGTPAPQGQSAPAPAPQTANNNNAPTNTPAPQGNNNQQSPGNNQAQPQEQQAQPSEKETKVTECINQINNVVQKNDPYTLLALNIPDLIKQSFPDFGNDAAAKDAMGKWEAFKKAPTAESFKSFTDAFVAFGKAGQDGQTQQNQQQQQQSAPQDAVNQQAESEYRAYTFSQRLNEKLQDRMKISNALKSFNNYNPFNF